MKERILALLLGAMVLMPTALAQETVEVRAGFLPGHPLYALDRAVEKLQLFLTIGNERRAKFHLALASERLAELEELIRLNVTEHYGSLIDDFEEQMNLTSDEVDELNDSDGVPENLYWRVAEATAKHQLVLQRVMAKAPEPALKGLQRAFSNAEERRGLALGHTKQFVNRSIENKTWKHNYRNLTDGNLTELNLTEMNMTEGNLTDVGEGSEGDEDGLKKGFTQGLRKGLLKIKKHFQSGNE